MISPNAWEWAEKYFLLLIIIFSSLLIHLFHRALYVNLIGVILMISLACLCGIGLFAYYADCDPLKAGKIVKSDQVSE